MNLETKITIYKFTPQVFTLTLNRGNGAGVVMISLEEYNSLKETEYIMSSEQTMNDIRKGEEDLKAGKGIEVNLDEL